MKFQYAILLVVLIALGAHAARREYNLDLPAKTLFNQWLIDNPTTFGSTKHRLTSFNIFSENLEKIKELNKIHEGRTQFMLNQFALISEEEFTRTYLGAKVPTDFKYNPEIHNMLAPVPESQLKDLPETVDWRKTNPPAVSPVKNQGSCGSCWAFSATGNIEAQSVIAGNKMVELSNQQLVDCDHVCNEYNVCDSGCNGGLMENAYTYVMQYGGLAAETSYPYEGRDLPCRAKKEDIVTKISNFTFLPRDPKQMQHFVATRGTIAIAADATLWQFYYSGVWFFYCGNNLNHGIMIAGYGTVKNMLGTDVPYWLVKNSWGASWGMDGYILIERGNNRCGLEEYPITAIVHKN